MLALRVRQTLSQIGHCVVQRQTAHRQLGFLRLLLLVLGSEFLGAPLILLLLIQHVQSLHLTRPGINHRVYVPLSRCEGTRDVTDQVQRVHLAVNIQFHPCGQHADGRTDGYQHRHRHSRAYSIYRIFHTHRHLRQLVVVEALILLHSLLQLQSFRQSSSSRTHVIHPVAPHLKEHVLQPLGHLGALLRQCRIDALHLLRFRETVIARDDAVQHVAVKSADMAQVHRQLEGQHVSVRLHGFLPLVVEFPPLRHDVLVRETQIVRRERTRSLLFIRTRIARI